MLLIVVKKNCKGFRLYYIQSKFIDVDLGILTVQIGM